MALRGKFITLEGIDGAGKSTHLAWLADTLRAHGLEVVTTREPGGTPLGERLREMLLHEKMHGDTEALLMFAARAEHVRSLIAPALERGAWVISDRFTDATFAYQCGGRGLDPARIAVLEQWVHADVQPDLTFWFDAPVEVAQARVAQGTSKPDKFEREQSEFFSRVRAAYQARADHSGGRIRIIDSGQPIANIREALNAHLASISA
jgi:dTMP kinase